MVKLLFVHGINNQDNSAEAIKIDWSRWIAEGLEMGGHNAAPPLQVHAAFYGDILAKATEGRGSDAPTSTTEMGDGGADRASDAVASLYIEVQRRCGITDAVVNRYSESKATEAGDGIHKSWLKAIARALEDVFPTRGKYLAQTFLPQASAYLDAPGLKTQIDELVEEQIFHGLDPEEPTLVVAHSLGTIVCYSILRSLGHRVHSPLFLTLGSPLGIEIVKRRLHPIRKRPIGVARWVNGSDKEDFVALHPELNQASFGTDDIENITNIENNDDDRHSIRDYLRNKETATVMSSTFSNLMSGA